MHTYDSYGAKKISDVFQQWEKEKRIASINENPDTKKNEIEARIDRVQGTDDFFLKILYDPVTNTVEHGELFSRFKGIQYVMTIYDIEFQENENGIKFPKFVKEIYPLDHRIILSSYSSLKINPSLTENTFQVIIPDGINVSDYVLKQFYKVGDLIDEDKAISDFMTRYNLTGNVPVKTTAGGIVRYILIVVGSLMILASIVLFIRKRMQA
jgi:hypothetical protein